MPPSQPESKILKPRNPQITDENKWHIFTLSDALIFDQLNEATSLLEATKTNLVRVVGVLSEPPSELRRSSINSKKPITISIDVTHYSYGVYNNGEIDIWAAGQAGWFLLLPDASQKELFEDMRAAVKLFYYLADAYRADRKAALDTVLKGYAKRSRIGLEAARDLMVKHRRFLVIQMQRKAELGSWVGTSLYQLLKTAHSSAFNSITAAETPNTRSISRTSAPMISTKPAISKRVIIEAQESGRKSSRTAGTAPKPEVLTSRPGTARGTARYDNVTPNYDIQGDEDDASREDRLEQGRELQVDLLWKILQHEVKHDFMDPDDLTLAKAGAMVSADLTLEQKDAVDYLILHGHAIAAKMDQAQHQFRWVETPLYLGVANKNLHHAKANRLRRLEITLREGIEESDLQQLAKYEDATDELAPSTPHLSKGGLRPPSGKKTGKRYSGKSKGKSKARQSALVEDDNVIVIDDEDDDASIGSKRKASQHDGRPARKSRRLDESENASSDLEVNSDEADSDEPSDDDLLSTPQKSTTQTLLDLKIDSPSLVSRPSQDTQPTDPGDIWRCSHDGCMHTVYGASGEMGQNFITEHLGEHDVMIKLVRGEQGKTRLPVSNLLNLLKMRGMPGSVPEMRPPGFEADATAGYSVPMATATETSG